MLRLAAGSVVSLLFFLLPACGKDPGADEPGPGFADESSRYAGLALTLVDSSYSASRLLYNDLKTGTLKTVLTAESGDPILFWHGQELLFFNRSNDRRNFKRLDPRQADIGLSTEMATPLAQTGDPTALISLTSDDVLVAHRAAGVVFVMNVKTGALVQEVVADWDFGGKVGAQLRPVALLAWDATTIYVLHQGKGNDAAQSLNGTQQVFVLNVGIDGKVFVVDQDDLSAGVQGIKLPLSNPGHLIKRDGKLLVVGTCMLWDGACTSGFAAVDVATKVVTMLYDTSALALKGNGGMVGGQDGVFYGATVVDTGDPMQSGDKAITTFTPAAKTAATFMTFPAASAGCCSLYHDDTNGSLWIGDSEANGTGSLTVYKTGAARQTLNLAARPFEGLFIAP